MAKHRDRRRGFLARWYHRLRWLRRLAVIGALAGGIAKVLQGRSGGGAAGGFGAEGGGSGGSGRPAPVGGPTSPSRSATATPPRDGDQAASASSASAGGTRTLVSVPPLPDAAADDAAEGVEVTEIAAAATFSTSEPEDGTYDDAADSGPILTVVGEPDAKPEPEATGDRAWLPPLDDGQCPPGYPVKANDKSGIYHVPGGRFYDRTVAERCYAKPEGAAADGYRPAKR